MLTGKPPISLSNRRYVLGFPADALVLRESCSLHGVPPELLGDNERSFRWMVSHLFKGDCVCVTDSIPGLGLYEDSACARSY